MPCILDLPVARRANTTARISGGAAGAQRHPESGLPRPSVMTQKRRRKKEKKTNQDIGMLAALAKGQRP